MLFRSKKRTMDEPKVVRLTKECNALLLNKMPQKMDDPGSFCVPCMIGNKQFNALCDLGSSVSVIPLAVCQRVGLSEIKSTNMTLQLADRTYRKPTGILIDVPMMVDKFAYPVDFVVLEMEDSGEAIILGRPFLATAGALIDVKGANITLRFGDEEIIFDMNHPSGLPPCIE